MNSQFPGILPGSSTDDVELAGLATRVETDMARQVQPGHVPAHYDQHDSESDEEDLDVDEEGSRALLGSQERGMSSRKSPSKIWLQISSIVVESAPTLLFTTIGLLFTGELLDQVSRWRAMREVDQLIMIIPVVLNLKGNLEMNLSARLGTAANVGELDDASHRRSMIVGNLSLLQVQATVVSFIAACVSLILSLVVPHTTSTNTPDVNTTISHVVNSTILLGTRIPPILTQRRPLPVLPNHGSTRRFGFSTFIMIASTAMSAACLSSLILGSFMCGLIVVCRKFGRDPDNIAPPIASCLGDLVTLCFVGVVSSILIRFINTPIPFILAILVVCSAVVCLVFTRRNPLVKPLLTQGWSPLFGAMIISSATGIVLDLFVSRYEGFALLAVVISGLPGSVGSIFVSRLSTALHAAALSLSTTRNATEPSPRLVMITLLVITVPVEIIFLAILRGFGWLKLPFVFVAFSVVFFCCAVLTSLIIARFLTNYLWGKDLDPDLYALPIHSALMDLIGQLLLVLCFEIVSLLGIRVAVARV